MKKIVLFSITFAIMPVIIMLCFLAMVFDLISYSTGSIRDFVQISLMARIATFLARLTKWNGY